MILWVRVETVAKYDAGDGDFRLKRRFEKLSGEPQIGTVSATTTGWFCEQGYYPVDAVA